MCNHKHAHFAPDAKVSGRWPWPCAGLDTGEASSIPCCDTNCPSSPPLELPRSAAAAAPPPCCSHNEFSVAHAVKKCCAASASPIESSAPCD